MALTSITNQLSSSRLPLRKASAALMVASSHPQTCRSAMPVLLLICSCFVQCALSASEMCYWLRLAVAGTQLQRRGFSAAEYADPWCSSSQHRLSHSPSIALCTLLTVYALGMLMESGIVLRHELSLCQRPEMCFKILTFLQGNALIVLIIAKPYVPSNSLSRQCPSADC